MFDNNCDTNRIQYLILFSSFIVTFMIILSIIFVIILILVEAMEIECDRFWTSQSVERKCNFSAYWVIWMDMKYIYKVLFFVIIIIDHYYL